jgi:hypothetical protein
VPKSKIRKKDTSASKPAGLTKKQAKAANFNSGRWVVPTMIALFLIGLLWIVVFYLTQGDFPGMRELGNWNILVGFAFIGGGFVVSTRWK